jgi:TonB family protein
MGAGTNGAVRVMLLRSRDRGRQKKTFCGGRWKHAGEPMSRITGWRLAGRMVIVAFCVVPLVEATAACAQNEGGTATEELRSLMTAATAAAREGDQAKLKEITHGLGIPNFKAWFKTTFGEKDGGEMATAYQKSLDLQENWLPELFEGLSKEQGEWQVEELKESNLPATTSCRQALAKAAKNGAAIYQMTLQMTGSGGTKTGRSAGYYALVEGAYRRLDCAEIGLSGPLRVGGNVQAKRIINRVQPVYPEEARKKGISGTVRLHVIVTKDGSIRKLEVMSGHPLLQQAALDAVRQWRYQSTLLNGSPVEVDTTIDVIFSLNSPR